jgi:hypothetical protein
MDRATPRNSSGVHTVSWLLLAVAVGLAVLVVGRMRRHAPAPGPERVDPLLLVPPGPRLLISADVGSLSKVASHDLARLGGEKLLGLRETCGFEPLLALERAVFAMPFVDATSPGTGSDFAFIAATSIDAQRGLTCAEKVIQKRGGSAGRTQLGGFTSVRDLSKPVGEVAFRPDGTFVLSGGPYFRDVMDAAGGTVKLNDAAKLRTQLHRSLRDKLGTAQLKLTLLPEASSVLRGVLALGLGIEIAADVAVRGVVVCASAEACRKAHDVIDGAKTEMAKEPGLSGLATLVVSQAQDRLELKGRLPREQLGPLLAQLLSN